MRSRQHVSGTVLTRRHLLRTGASALVALAAGPARALATHRARALGLHHLHTGESLRIEYWSEGTYHPEALHEIDHLLRDHRSGSTISIDRSLLDLLHALQSAVDSPRSFEIVSGYRSPETNEALRRQGRGVARRSLHTQGMAVDVRLPGCELSVLRRAALDLGRGGVGYYPDSRFVHVDTGRVRFW